ncbi:PfkB family carbohydrate kinase [Salinicola peritrichatus]|uniref:PfkB family carbohydrate kinase n=1 Tax=Salinicola peritrichatus TaxID=1267424 RepID=UPI0019550731|nr:PfkB family carbohydrate kinase [Salinicola peritrichatus]
MNSTSVPIPRLWHTGQAVVDIVMTIDELPAPGGDTIAQSTSYEVGGGFNVMAAARRYGMPVVYAGKHGTGPMGDRVRDALVSEGIVLASAADPDGDSGFCVALIDEQGERTFISQVGIEGHVDHETLGALSPPPADWVYISGYSLAYPGKADPLLDWLDTLDETVSVVFDPGPLVARIDRSALQRLLPRITLWSSNADETRGWTGLADLSVGVEAIASRLAESATVIVRDGPRGCWLRRLGETWLVEGFSTVAVDTNGAGDAHTGVLIAALAEGSSLPDACVRANAAAAIAVSRRGPATAPTRTELEAFLAMHGVN